MSTLSVSIYLRMPTYIYIISNGVDRHESTCLCRGSQSLVAARTKDKTESMTETPSRRTAVQQDVEMFSDIMPEINSELQDGITGDDESTTQTDMSEVA